MRETLETLHFTVAGLPFELSADSAKVIKELFPSYAPFWRKTAEGECRLRVEIAHDGQPAPPAEAEKLGVFDSGECSYGVYRVGRGYHIAVADRATGESTAALTAGERFESCRVSLSPDAPLERRQFGAGNALMVAFAFMSAYHGVLFMHSSVTLYNGRGYLFLGHSGTGKSTHSRMWRESVEGAELLNDDNPCVRIFPDGTARVYGTPWSGSTPCYRDLSAPVGAVVRIEQWKDNLIDREPPLRAFASLFSSCSTMMWDKPSYDAIVRTAEKVVSAVPVFTLRCRPDHEAAAVCRAAVCGEPEKKEEGR